MACRLGVLTMDIHSPRANNWTLEQHPAFNRFTNQPTTFAVRPRHQPRSSSLSIILYPLKCSGTWFLTRASLTKRGNISPKQIPSHNFLVVVVVVDHKRTIYIHKILYMYKLFYFAQRYLYRALPSGVRMIYTNAGTLSSQDSRFRMIENRSHAHI